MQLSKFLTSVCRAALTGPVPMHVDNAATSGTGKSFTNDINAAICQGERCPVIPFTKKNIEENEKRLIKAVLSGRMLVNIDNCNGPLLGGVSCSN